MLEGILATYLPQRRWFGSKTRTVKRLVIEDVLRLGRRSAIPAAFTMLRVEYDEGEAENFGLLLAAVPADSAAPIEAALPWAAIAPIRRDGDVGVHLMDGLAVPQVAADFLALIGNRVTLSGGLGTLECTSKRALRSDAGLPPSVQRNEQSNTSVSYGDRFMLKFVRRLESGVHPQLEIEEFLASSPVAANVPQLLGTAVYRRGGRTSVVAIVERYINHQSDGWRLAVDEFSRFLEEMTSAVVTPPELRTGLHPLEMSLPDPFIEERTGPWLEMIANLGKRTAQLHAALADSSRSEEFAPEKYTLFYQRALAQGFRVQARHAMRSLRSSVPMLPEEAATLAAEVLAAEPVLLKRLHAVASRPLRGDRIRCHGDLHLGQVLSTGSDWVFIDFEGEPSRSLSDRRVKRSPLRDVAGMVRSFRYAAHFSLRQVAAGMQGSGRARAGKWADCWYLWTASRYLNSYFEEIKDAGIIAPDAEETRFLLDTFILDKALYELAYELDNRPSWVHIPLRGILDLLKADNGEVLS